jgi:hypothetical protein
MTCPRSWATGVALTAGYPVLIGQSLSLLNSAALLRRRHG